MAVYTSNLALTTDSDFSQIFTLENAETNSPTNLTGFTIAATIRKHPAAKRGEAFQATIINATGGKIRLGMSGVKSRILADEGFFRTGRYILFLKSSNWINTIYGYFNPDNMRDFNLLSNPYNVQFIHV